MPKMAVSLVLKLMGISTCFFALCNADLASEQAANSVELKFYRLQSSTWDSGSLETTLAGLIVSQANTYCSNNLDACEMYSCCNAAFKEIDVGKVADYPVNANKDMLYKLNLKYPAGSDIKNDSTLDFVISKSTLQAIIGNIRDDVKKDLGYYITYVGSDFYGIPPASLANRVIIPLACVVLLVLIIITVVLHFWNKKREERERMEKKVLKRQEKFKKGKEQPKYDVDTEEPKVPPTPDKKTEEKEKKTRRRRVRAGAEEKMYKSKDIKMSPAKQHHGGASDTDSAIKMEDRNDDHLDKFADSGVIKHKSLPPLKADDEPPVAEDKKERKKKKKEKKKKKSRRKEDGADNSAYLGGASDDENALTTEL